MLFLAALLLATPAGSGQEDLDDDLRYPGPDESPEDVGWIFFARDRIGPPGDTPVYVLDAWQPSPSMMDRETSYAFLFEISWFSNDTRVVPGPELRLAVAHCTPERPEEREPCDRVRIVATETRHGLQDNATGRLDGRYVWIAPEERAMNEPGSWRVTVWSEDLGEGAAATYHVGVEAPILPLPWLTDLVLRLFGIGVSPLGRFLVFVFWLAFFVLTAGLLATILKRTVFSPRRMDPTIRRLSVRLTTALWVLFGFAMSLWIGWRVNFWAALAALGLLSVALGFGMQNTVANIMGGINLALDKPFVVGDRVRIGDTWGEVEEVGIRSTSISTTKKETVVIPNKLMDEREIWNYTTNQSELRRDVQVLISYDADRRLAEALMLRVAREHRDLLPYPRPRVFLREFADHGLLMELRAWIPDARDLRPIGSELRKSIMDRFEEHGIEIPYPYRTLVEKKDLSTPRRAPQEEIESIIGMDERLPRMLYATSGPDPLQETADIVARIASELDMQLIVLHVQPQFTKARRAESYRIMNAFQIAATRHKIPFKGITREGDVADAVQSAAIGKHADLVVFGSSRPPFGWGSRAVADFTREIREEAKIPVMILPRNLSVTTRALKHYQGIMEERHSARRPQAKVAAEQDEQEQTQEEQGAVERRNEEGEVGGGGEGGERERSGSREGRKGGKERKAGNEGEERKRGQKDGET